MSFPHFLRELGQLIQERAVISCIHPRLVAMDTVNELAGLTCAHPGLPPHLALPCGPTSSVTPLRRCCLSRNIFKTVLDLS